MEDQRKQYRTFYGSSTSNSCAYCYKHHLAMTPQQMKKRKCLEKRCGALQRCEHPYWEQREKTGGKNVSAQKYVQRDYDEQELEERLGVNELFKAAEE